MNSENFQCQGLEFLPIGPKKSNKVSSDEERGEPLHANIFFVDTKLGKLFLRKGRSPLSVSMEAIPKRCCDFWSKSETQVAGPLRLGPLEK